jgi:pantoate--beta-alanine ligase
MYPPGGATAIEPCGPAERWEGAARPGHFRGVATVCAKLFGQVRPGIAVFGEKDWQQLQVVSRMVADLHLPLSIDPAPTVREADGLALSSRNRFLDAAARATAPVLHDTLVRTAHAMRSVAAETALAEGRAVLAHHGFEVDYLALVDALTLEPIAAPRPPSRLIAAARLGGVRLIDNLPGPS